MRIPESLHFLVLLLLQSRRKRADRNYYFVLFLVVRPDSNGTRSVRVSDIICARPQSVYRVSTCYNAFCLNFPRCNNYHPSAPLQPHDRPLERVLRFHLKYDTLITLKASLEGKELLLFGRFALLSLYHLAEMVCNST